MVERHPLMLHSPIFSLDSMGLKVQSTVWPVCAHVCGGLSWSRCRVAACRRGVNCNSSLVWRVRQRDSAPQQPVHRGNNRWPGTFWFVPCNVGRDCEVVKLSAIQCGSRNTPCKLSVCPLKCHRYDELDTCATQQFVLSSPSAAAFWSRLTESVALEIYMHTHKSKWCTRLWGVSMCKCDHIETIHVWAQQGLTETSMSNIFVQTSHCHGKPGSYGICKCYFPGLEFNSVKSVWKF